MVLTCTARVFPRTSVNSNGHLSFGVFGISDVAGTTRDPIDTEIIVDGRAVVLIDTAGIRRVRLLKENVDHVSVVQARRAIERADEWEKITGASVTRSVCRMQSAETCEMSTIIPNRFISRMISSPNGERPPLIESSLHESAQSNDIE